MLVALAAGCGALAGFGMVDPEIGCEFAGSARVHAAVTSAQVGEELIGTREVVANTHLDSFLFVRLSARW